MTPRSALIAAPLFAFAYGAIRILDGLDGSYGPGLAWTAGHLAFMAALLLFAWLFLWFRTLAGRDALTTAGAVAGLVGVVALLVQFGIDIAVGFAAADRDGMNLLFQQVQSVPGVPFTVYDGLPFLFYVAQLVLMIRLAVLRVLPVWTLAPVLVYLALPIVWKDLIPVSALFMLVALLPLIRRPAVALAAV
jgi:hypothetical protein